jgi:hypothetical protein
LEGETEENQVQVHNITVTSTALHLPVGVSSLLLYLFDQPVHRGFFCDDDSICYPVPAYQTVSNAVVIIMALGMPILMVRRQVPSHLPVCSSF